MKSHEIVANTSVLSIALLNAGTLGTGFAIDLKTGSVLSLFLINIACFSVSAVASRPIASIVKSNADASHLRGVYSYFPVFMPLLYLVNLVAILYTLSLFTALPQFSFIVSNLVFAAFGFFVVGELKLEELKTRSSIYTRMRRLYDNSLPTFLPMLLAVYLVLVPGDFLLAQVGGDVFQHSPFRVALNFCLLVLGILAFVGISKIFPKVIEISYEKKLSLTIAEIAFGLVTFVGFIAFDLIVGVFLEKFHVAGPGEIVLLIIFGIIPFRIFNIIYSESKTSRKTLGLLLVAFYYVVKYFFNFKITF